MVMPAPSFARDVVKSEACKFSHRENGGQLYRLQHGVQRDHFVMSMADTIAFGLNCAQAALQTSRELVDKIFSLTCVFPDQTQILTVASLVHEPRVEGWGYCATTD